MGSGRSKSPEGRFLAVLSRVAPGSIYRGVEDFYKRFYFRPAKIWEIVREMLVSWEMMKRRLQEGVQFFQFLREHKA